MISAFCPAHITCFFQPVDSAVVLEKGSKGSGLRLDKGASVSMSENRSGRTDVIMDGVPSEAPITRRVIELALPGRGFDVTVTNGLPIGQGFGMSAAGAIAVALCAKEIVGYTEQEAYEYAHRAEVELGGGLGDVSAIMSNAHQPVRVTPGLPPRGKVIDTHVDLKKLSVAVLGPKMRTSGVLGDPVRYRAICEAGSSAVDRYISAPLLQSLYELSNEFSRSTGLESEIMHDAICDLKAEGIMSGMCMLGNSIFVNADANVVSDIISVRAVDVSTTCTPAMITRKV